MTTLSCQRFVELGEEQLLSLCEQHNLRVLAAAYLQHLEREDCTERRVYRSPFRIPDWCAGEGETVSEHRRNLRMAALVDLLRRVDSALAHSRLDWAFRAIELREGRAPGDGSYCEWRTEIMA